MKVTLYVLCSCMLLLSGCGNLVTTSNPDSPTDEPVSETVSESNSDIGNLASQPEEENNTSQQASIQSPESPNAVISIDPILEIHSDNKCDLSEYAVGLRTTTEHEHYETERFFVDIEAGCTVPVNLNALLDQCITYTEKLTGMSLEAEYGKKLYGEKITFYISKSPYAAGGADAVYLNEQDTFLYSGDMWVLIHELTHCLERRNAPYLGQVLTEGHSTYVTKLAVENTYLPYLFSADFNYSFYEQEITAANAETLFETLSDWDTYLYGYRFSTFLHEQYGADIYQRIMEKTLEEKASNQQLTTEQLAEIVKAVTEETVFEKFAKWYKTNKSRFEVYTSSSDTRNFSRMFLFSFNPSSTEFNQSNLIISDFLTLDLSVWREFTSFTTNTLQGNFSVAGTGTLEFYDSQDNLIHSCTLTDEAISVTLADVNYIQASGESFSLNYNFNYTDSSSIAQ